MGRGLPMLLRILRHPIPNMSDPGAMRCTWYCVAPWLRMPSPKAECQVQAYPQQHPEGPDYDTFPLVHFEPMVRNVLSKPLNTFDWIKFSHREYNEPKTKSSRTVTIQEWWIYLSCSHTGCSRNCWSPRKIGRNWDQIWSDALSSQALPAYEICCRNCL